MAAELLQQNSGVLVSDNNARVNRVESELQALTTNLDEVVVRPKAARAKLAACAWTVWWCITVARLHQVWLEGGSDLARARRVMSRWTQSWRRNETNTSSSGLGALLSTRVETDLTTR